MVDIPLFTGFYTSQVVVWDFWTINSITFSATTCNNTQHKRQQKEQRQATRHVSKVICHFKFGTHGINEAQWKNTCFQIMSMCCFLNISCYVNIIFYLLVSTWCIIFKVFPWPSPIKPLAQNCWWRTPRRCRGKTTGTPHLHILRSSMSHQLAFSLPRFPYGCFRKWGYP